ncbi:MAG: AhpC/TSA family protein [Bacteroidales bacterium]|nr:AhpC/TSA family protein [Bacteroidales bacterium]
MKKLILIMAAVAALASCAPKHMFSGNISGIDSGKLLFVCNNEADEMVMDSVLLDNGKFHFDPASTKPQILMIVDRDHFIDYITMYVVPDEYCVINGTMTDYTVTGSKFYKDWGAFHETVKGNLAKLHDLRASIPTEEDPDFDMAAYSAKEREISKEWNDLAIDFIRKNPESDVCAYIARELTNADYFYEADEIISDKVKKGKLGYLIEERAQIIDGEAIRQASAKNIYEGAEAPDFSLKTSTGETFTLSEHRGGYVMLDFWGTWCGWCVEGLPNVKEIAHRYKDKLTVVSVDCGDSEEAWQNGIKKYEMDWVQVYNSRADAVDSKFAVQGYPGFYLIDPEGKIKMMAFGEPAHFVEKIGELISE